MQCRLLEQLGDGAGEPRQNIKKFKRIVYTIGARNSIRRMDNDLTGPWINRPYERCPGVQKIAHFLANLLGGFARRDNLNREIGSEIPESFGDTGRRDALGTYI